jgi:C1A family cysteine protease
MNSWGTSWATAGFGYIAYANIAAWWSEAYVIN